MLDFLIAYAVSTGGWFLLGVAHSALRSSVLCLACGV